MQVITLQMQLDFAQTCLEAMRKKLRSEDEIAIQESICWTLETRIEEKKIQAG